MSNADLYNQEKEKLLLDSEMNQNKLRTALKSFKHGKSYKSQFPKYEYDEICRLMSELRTLERKYGISDTSISKHVSNKLINLTTNCAKQKSYTCEVEIKDEKPLLAKYQDSEKVNDLKIKLEKKKIEAEKLEKDRLESERIEDEKREKEIIEMEKDAREKLRLEKLEKDRLEKEKLQQQNLENAKILQAILDADDKEKFENERFFDLEKQEMERKQEMEKLEKAKLEKMRLSNQKIIDNIIKKDAEKLQKEKKTVEDLKRIQMEFEYKRQAEIAKNYYPNSYKAPMPPTFFYPTNAISPYYPFYQTPVFTSYDNINPPPYSYNNSVDMSIYNANINQISTHHISKPNNPTIINNNKPITHPIVSNKTPSVTTKNISNKFNTSPIITNNTPIITNNTPIITNNNTPIIANTSPIITNNTPNKIENILQKIFPDDYKKYLDIFEREKIDYDAFLELDRDIMKELGILMGPAIKIYKAIKDRK